MMKLTSVLLTLTLALAIKTSSQGINFENGLSWEEIKAKAKIENKYIFLDVYATWCGPCKQMDIDVFPQKATGDLINANFIAVKVQTDSTEVDSEIVKNWRADASRIKKEYRIQAYPTYVFLAPNGQLVHIATGSMSESAFLIECKRALNPAEQYTNLIHRYQSGERDPEFIRYLVKRAGDVKEKVFARKVAVDYINSLNEHDLFTKENIWFVYGNTKTSADRGFSFFLNNVDKIVKADSFMQVRYCKGLTAKIIIEEEILPYFRDCGGKPDWNIVRNKLVSKYGKVGEEIWKTDRPGWMIKYVMVPFLNNNPPVSDIEDKIESLKRDVKEEQLFGHTVLYYLSASDNPNANLKMICDRVVYFWNTYVDRFPDNISVGKMNQQAWFIFERSNDKKHLTSALAWAKKGVDMSPPSVGSNIDLNSRVIDTYANLLYKVGRTKEAIEWEEKAFNLVPKSYDFTEALKKMRAGKPTWPINGNKL